MTTFSKDSIHVLRFAPEAQSVAASVNSETEKMTAASVINTAANAGQTSCVIEQSLKPETIQDLIANGYIVENIGRADKTRPVLVNWSKKVTSSTAGDYEDVGHNSPIYNKKTLSEYIWIELPTLAKNFLLTGMTKMQPSQEEVSDISSIIQDNIWLKVTTELLDTTAGKKVYKIYLKHKCLDDTMSLYFGYNIQDDEPDKSYVYM